MKLVVVGGSVPSDNTIAVPVQVRRATPEAHQTCNASNQQQMKRADCSENAGDFPKEQGASSDKLEEFDEKMMWERCYEAYHDYIRGAEEPENGQPYRLMIDTLLQRIPDEMKPGETIAEHVDRHKKDSIEIHQFQTMELAEMFIKVRCPNLVLLENTGDPDTKHYMCLYAKNQQCTAFLKLFTGLGIPLIHVCFSHYGHPVEEGNARVNNQFFGAVKSYMTYYSEKQLSTLELTRNISYGLKTASTRDNPMFYVNLYDIRAIAKHIDKKELANIKIPNGVCHADPQLMSDPNYHHPYIVHAEKSTLEAIESFANRLLGTDSGFSSRDVAIETPMQSQPTPEPDGTLKSLYDQIRNMAEELRDFGKSLTGSVSHQGRLQTLEIRNHLLKAIELSKLIHERNGARSAIPTKLDRNKSDDVLKNFTRPRGGDNQIPPLKMADRSSQRIIVRNFPDSVPTKPATLVSQKAVLSDQPKKEAEKPIAPKPQTQDTETLLKEVVNDSVPSQQQASLAATAKLDKQNGSYGRRPIRNHEFRNQYETLESVPSSVSTSAGKCSSASTNQSPSSIGLADIYAKRRSAIAASKPQAPARIEKPKNGDSDSDIEILFQYEPPKLRKPRKESPKRMMRAIVPQQKLPEEAPKEEPKKTPSCPEGNYFDIAKLVKGGFWTGQSPRSSGSDAFQKELVDTKTMMSGIEIPLGQMMVPVGPSSSSSPPTAAQTVTSKTESNTATAPTNTNKKNEKKKKKKNKKK